MSELNHDIEGAKERLKEVEATKEARNDPRTGDTSPAPSVGSKKPDAPVEKNIRPVAKPPKTKSFGRKLKEAMFSEDIGKGSVSDYIFFKVMIPRMKQIFSDMCNSAINMALGLDPKTRTVGTTHTANASVYRDRNYSRYSNDPGYGRGRDAISDLEWDYETTKDIYNQMVEVLENYPSLTLSDVYSICNKPTLIRSTDQKWGWTSMRGIEIVPADRNEDWWYIDMPPARPV